MIPVPVLWLHDPTAGEGKSGIGWQLFTRSVEAGTPTAYIDLEFTGTLAPAAADQGRFRAKVLAALWPGYRDAGARAMVVFSALDVPDAATRCAEALPGAVVTVCRTDGIIGTDADVSMDAGGPAEEQDDDRVDEIVDVFLAAAKSWPVP